MIKDLFAHTDIIMHYVKHVIVKESYMVKNFIVLKNIDVKNVHR